MPGKFHAKFSQFFGEIDNPVKTKCSREMISLSIFSSLLTQVEYECMKKMREFGEIFWMCDIFEWRNILNDFCSQILKIFFSNGRRGYPLTTWSFLVGRADFKFFLHHKFYVFLFLLHPFSTPPHPVRHCVIKIDSHKVGKLKNNSCCTKNELRRNKKLNFHQIYREKKKTK